MQAPWEEIDGVVFEYWNNPTQFIQPHIRMFQSERRHFQRYKERMPEYGALNLRWIQAEDWYQMWLDKYQADEIAKARTHGPNGIS